MSFYGKSSRLILEHRSLPASTKKFMKDVAITNKAEIMLGQLALQKSSNDKIKEFAQKMIDDHSKAQEELSKLASNEDVREFYLGVSNSGRKSLRDVKHYKRRKRWLS